MGQKINLFPFSTWLENQIVAQVVVGSSLITRPM